MLIIGHRGASGDAPENTERAFQLAFEQGADGIECDLIQHNEHCYIIHDLRLERTTNGEGYVLEHTYDTLRKLDAGNGEQIPTLPDVLNCLAPNTLCNLEIKHLQDAESFVQQLQQLVLHHDIALEQIIVSSFHHGWLRDIQTLWPRLTVAHLISHYPAEPDTYFSSLPGHMVNMALDMVDSALIAAAQQQGKKVWIYTVNTEADMKVCALMGADGIFTNYPAKGIQVKQELAETVC